MMRDRTTGNEEPLDDKDVTRRSAPGNPGLIARWARFAVRRKWAVLAAWAAVIAVLGVVSTTFGGEYDPGFRIPNVESQQAIDLLDERFPQVSGDTATIVFQSGNGIADEAVAANIADVLGQIGALPEVIGVTSPDQQPGAISADGTIGFATVQFDKPAAEIDATNVEDMLAIVDAANGGNLVVEAGGQVVADNEAAVESRTSEIVGIVVAMVIMLVMFGSVVAMGLPIITAVAGLALSLLVAPIFANWFTMSDAVTLAFASMMGLGVGIDYALFIVNRYRDGLLAGKSAEEAAVRAIDTSGRAVIFAGVTVAIALLGLIVIQIPFVTGLGIVGAIVVLLSVVVSIFLMPALLGVVGTRVLSWRIPGLGREPKGQDSFWYRWGRGIQKRPGLISAVVVVGLLILSIPFFDMRLGLSDAGNNAEETHTRRAYDLVSEGFGPGLNGPLLVVVDEPDGIDPDLLAGMASSIQETEGVAFVSQPIPNEAGDTAILQVIPQTSPQDEETAQLVDRLRDETLPVVLADSGTEAYVGGSTAANVDLSEKISERMPLFFIVVIGLSLILLTTVFRSVVVPLKAALMNLLSIGAAFGAVVAVFQWGWLGELIGVSQAGPVESFLPMILFGIVFGLSMDYEVFLLSRVHEEYTHTKDAKRSMLDGVAGSGKVIAAAGGIMASVFFAFVLGDARVIKELGFGLGVAVVVDAFIVRLILVPAVMTLLDGRAWYMPGWLDRILPKLNVEGEPDEEGETLPGNVAPMPAD
jgi:RND superfamily putative drug exporter